MNNAPAFRAKVCKVCGISFIPLRAMASVCSPMCAMKKVRADKAQGKRELRARKEAIKTIPELLKEAQTAFNAYIRKRDEGKPCICCGKPTSGGHEGVRSHNVDAGHWRSVGAAPHLRFHEDNCHGQLVACNRYGAGRAVDYRIGLVRRIGAERVEILENLNYVKKWTREELIEIRAKYKAKLKELEKNGQA